VDAPPKDRLLQGRDGNFIGIFMLKERLAISASAALASGYSSTTRPRYRAASLAPLTEYASTENQSPVAKRTKPKTIAVSDTLDNPPDTTPSTTPRLDMDDEAPAALREKMPTFHDIDIVLRPPGAVACTTARHHSR